MEYLHIKNDRSCEAKPDVVQSSLGEQAMTEGTTLHDEETSSSISRRPLTRSQTRNLLTRRSRDESSRVVPKSAGQTASSRKRPRLASLRDDDASVATDLSPSESSHSADSTKTSQTYVESLAGPMHSLLAAAMGPSPDPSKFPHFRTVRPRTILPVPVPNLTKKSRGRRVPTKPLVSVSSSGMEAPESRIYVCLVENCGKCFHRGEHLKRHIRSIHTHEKPFKCTHPCCGKFFNRHDNLLQHLKVHQQKGRHASPRSERHTPPDRETYPEQDEYMPSVSRSILHDSTFLPQSTRMQHFPQSPILPKRMMSYRHDEIYSAYATSPFTLSSEPVSFANMAVSSLRTEIPHSPPPSSGLPDTYKHFSD